MFVLLIFQNFQNEATDIPKDFCSVDLCRHINNLLSHILKKSTGEAKLLNLYINT